MEQKVEKSARDSFKEMRRCNRAGIRIYPIPWGSRFKIEIDQNGKISRGDQTYPVEAEKTLLGVYDKIQELYKEISVNLDKQQNFKAA